MITTRPPGAVVFDERLRKPIGRGAVAIVDLVRASNLRRLKAGPFEAEWWKEAYDTQASLDRPRAQEQEGIGAGPDSLMDTFGDLANISPAAAIGQAHAQVEEALRQKLSTSGYEDDAARTLSATSLARRSFQRGLISATVVPAVEGITALRNLAEHHGGVEVTREQAREYLNLADAVMFALRQPP